MTTNVAIVGAYGSAGIAVATTLASEPDIDLTLIDNGNPGGGLCILRGCMPSKEVLSAGAHRYHTRHDHRLTGSPNVDLDAVIDTKNEHTSNFAAHRRAAVERLADQVNVEFIHGPAQFVDDRTITVNDRQIDADYVVIATGSTINIPELPGITEVPYYTSADVLDARSFPDTGIVMGFGYVGLELVPYLAEAGGMELTVIEHDDRPLDEADPAFGDTLIDLYEREYNVTILTNTTEQSVTQSRSGGISLTVTTNDTERTIDADSLFLFTGRKPAVGSLNLSVTSLDPGPEWVESTMQSTDDAHVFVVGDVNGREPLLHIAKEQGFTAGENILAHRDETELTPYDPTPHHVVFTALGVYPYARVGHTEQSAQHAGIPYQSVARDATDDGVFTTKTVSAGHATLVVGSDGTVLGYQGLHHHADVMAKTMQLVIELELDVRDLPDRAFHPTTPEILDGLFRSATELFDSEE